MAKNRAFGVAVVAGVVGAIAGLLFAPKSGKETRQDIKEAAEDVKQRAADKSDKVKDAASAGARQAKGTWNRTAKEFGELAEDAKTRAGRVAEDARTTADTVAKDTKKRLGDHRKDEV